MQQHPIPIKKLVSNKQPSLISLTCKIQESKKGRHAHTSTQCGPIFYGYHGMQEMRTAPCKCSTE